eukprot:augustus_masked-scaffold_7-processed-gene-19.95-mRNA-1 protein AED:1.00 eAED:1.00 QI:0/-1/0/0/-1/1/1/0/564
MIPKFHVYAFSRKTLELSITLIGEQEHSNETRANFILADEDSGEEPNFPHVLAFIDISILYSVSNSSIQGDVFFLADETENTDDPNCPDFSNVEGEIVYVQNSRKYFFKENTCSLYDMTEAAMDAEIKLIIMSHYLCEQSVSTNDDHPSPYGESAETFCDEKSADLNDDHDSLMHVIWNKARVSDAVLVPIIFVSLSHGLALEKCFLPNSPSEDLLSLEDDPEELIPGCTIDVTLAVEFEFGSLYEMDEPGAISLQIVDPIQYDNTDPPFYLSPSFLKYLLPELPEKYDISFINVRNANDLPTEDNDNYFCLETGYSHNNHCFIADKNVGNNLKQEFFLRDYLQQNEKEVFLEYLYIYYHRSTCVESRYDPECSQLILKHLGIYSYEDDGAWEPKGEKTDYYDKFFGNSYEPILEAQLSMNSLLYYKSSSESSIDATEFLDIICKATIEEENCNAQTDRGQEVVDLCYDCQDVTKFAKELSLLSPEDSILIVYPDNATPETSNTPLFLLITSFAGLLLWYVKSGSKQGNTPNFNEDGVFEPIGGNNKKFDLKEEYAFDDRIELS